MKRTYFQSGTAYTDTDSKKEALNAAIKKIVWFDIDVAKGVIPELPFSQGYAIRELVKYKGVNVDKVGYNASGRFCLLAFRNNYSNGEVKRVTVYVHDNGDEKLTFLCADEETEVST